MIRVAAIFCFSMTLFCPAFCLADSGDDCCEDGRPEVRNCEAMAVGAVLAEPVDEVGQPALAQPALDPILAIAPGPLLVADPGASPDRGASRPPPTARRRAFLQVFRF